MALSNWTEKNRKYVNLKLVAEVGPTTVTPKLVVVWEDFQLTNESYTKISWTLKFIKWTFTPKKGRMGDIYWFKAFLEDGDITYVIESTITNASKGLLNSLLWAKDQKVDVSLYINKNGYPTSSVRIGETFAPQALDFRADNISLFEEIGKVFVKKEEEESELKASDIPF